MIMIIRFFMVPVKFQSGWQQHDGTFERCLSASSQADKNSAEKIKAEKESHLLMAFPALCGTNRCLLCFPPAK
jgi:hypothetical protein